MLAEGVKNAHHIGKLELSHNRISDKGAVKLVESLTSKTNKIDLSYNKIGRIGGEIICKHLSSTKSLFLIYHFCLIF